jgi:hypothetical protein
MNQQKQQQQQQQQQQQPQQLGKPPGTDPSLNMRSSPQQQGNGQIGGSGLLSLSGTGLSMSQRITGEARHLASPVPHSQSTSFSSLVLHLLGLRRDGAMAASCCPGATGCLKDPCVDVT